jgi:hypothetical protein
MKNLTKLLLMGALVVVFGAISGPTVLAQIPETSFLNVTEPLNVGGTILQPGKYVIRVLPGNQNRNLLQVTNEDYSEIFTTVLSIPHATPAGEETLTEYVFYPAVAGTPRALRTWYAADAASQGGHDIVYPEGLAMELAPVVKEPVLAFKGDADVETLPAAPIVVVAPDKTIVVYKEPAPAPKPVMVAELEDLPDTASSLPLIATIGLLLIGLAFATRALRVV